MDLVHREDGFWWPADDDWCWRVIHDELPDLDRAVGLAKGWNVAVQAGGNVGVWAQDLAARFASVVTVEPMADNYACLVKNVSENVSHRCAAFGAAAGQLSMERIDGNAGAHYAKAGDGVPVITIDSLNLEACDLICLDIEGYEPFALQGAEQTIRKFRPVIMFEEKGLSERYYGVARGTAEQWVLDLGMGYRVRDRVRKDIILA